VKGAGTLIVCKSADEEFSARSFMSQSKQEALSNLEHNTLVNPVFLLSVKDTNEPCPTTTNN
jgi:hypothetical protein